MKETKTPQEQAVEHSEKLGFKVEALVLNQGEDTVIGFLKNPNREAKRAILDELLKSPTNAGKLYLDVSLVKEVSDPRLWSNDSDCDAIVMGAEMACVSKVELYQSEIKKK